jgi:hypothetical protein
MVGVVKNMKRSGVAVCAAALLMVLLGTVGTASAATPGYAVYNFQLTSQGHTDSFTVNETVAATSNAGSDTLILSIVTGSWNASYSRSVNASDELSPFLPAVTNQSLSYASKYGNITANISKNGTIPIEFQGAQYSLISYAFTLTGAYNSSSGKVQGSITTFPSGLINTVTVSANYPTLPGFGMGQLTGFNGSSIGGMLPFATTALQGTVSLHISLVATSLPLSISSSSVTAQAASVGIGAGAAASALAIGLNIKSRSKQKETAPEEKPDHWVD